MTTWNCTWKTNKIDNNDNFKKRINEYLLVNVCVCFISIQKCMFVSKCIAVSPIPFISLSKMSVSLYDRHLATAAKHTLSLTSTQLTNFYLILGL